MSTFLVEFIRLAGYLVLYLLLPVNEPPSNFPSPNVFPSRSNSCRSRWRSRRLMIVGSFPVMNLQSNTRE